VRYRDKASRDIDRLHDFIGQHNAQAATRVVGRVRAAVDLLAEFPLLGRAGAAPGSRELKLPGLPYVIVYRVLRRSEGIVILGVFHTAQMRPGQARPAEDD
jgi:plasmid stabilization system protein ParE